ncbi:MAG: rhodanese-like domain-containing protein [Flavobacteriaceae bacterium]
MLSLKNLFSKTSQNDSIHVLNKSDFQVAVKGKNIQLIDVRTPSEFQGGHISGAVNLNLFDNITFQKEVKKLDKEKSLYVYCQSGGRSKKASNILSKMGFKTIFDLKGGYSKW